MNEWLQKIKNMWDSICVAWLNIWLGRGCKVKTPIYDSMIRQLREIHEGIQDVRQSLIHDKNMLLKEIERREVIINAMMESSPDMLWFKDVQGKYLYANKAIRDNLLFSDNPVGKTDIQLATAAKKKFGDKNHTFGEVCGNSDQDVLENNYVGKEYVESGNVKGKMMHLAVNKSIVVVKGEVIGVVGSGRDITEYREELIRNGHEDVFKKNEFVNKDK